MSDVSSDKFRSRLPTLVEIATKKCIQNVSRLSDVGTTPFHLVKPILKKMNAKQLDLVEVTSPTIIPESDCLWIELIGKDFPDRPLYDKATSINNTIMPNKSLYFKYSKDRDNFRKDSAERLRNITEKLKLQKLANSIVSVPELLKDPTVRRNRVPSGFSRQYSNPQKNSILNKAKRDIQHRSIMFKNSNQPINKRYDPYDAFKYRNVTPKPPRRAPPPPPAPLPLEPSPPEPSPPDPTPQPAAPPEQLPNDTQRPIKRRKPQPTIFMNPRKRKPPSPAKKKTKPEPKQTSKITPIKSSIFN